MRILLSLFSLALTCQLLAQPYAIGHVSINFKDANRTGGFSIGGATAFPSGVSGRDIGTEIYYPASLAGNNTPVVKGQFPLIVFGHGFAMTWEAYKTFTDSMVRNGYIVALPRTEGSLLPAPNHLDFGKDLAKIADLMLVADTTSASLFFGKLNRRVAIGGHSMGGGATFLSDAYTNANVVCYFTFAAAETNPSAIVAATSITKPHLLFSGTYDCVTPPAQHQNLMYDTLTSACKTQINITKAYHCAFGDYNFNCSFGEGTCMTAGGLSSTAQQALVRMYVLPYLNYYLYGVCPAWYQFQSLTDTATVATVRQSCNNIVPSNAAVAGSRFLCLGDSILLTAQPPGFSYSWSNGSNDSTIRVSQAGNYTVTVSNNVCSLASAPIGVVQQLPPDIPVVIAPDTVCSQIANISISASADTAADFYVWTLPAGWVITQGDSTNSITAISSGSGGLISAIAQNACGLTSSVSQSVVVVPSSLGLPGNIAGDTIVCAGSTNSYAIQPVSGADYYIWNLPNGWSAISGTDSNSIHVNTAAGSGNISISAVNGCGQSQASSLNIVVRNKALISGAIGSSDTLCLYPDPAPFTFTISGINNADSFYWILPQDWAVTGSLNDTVLSAIGTASGTISVVAQNVCGSDTVSKFHYVSFLNRPVLSQNGDTLAAVEAASYQWYLNGLAISGATQQFYIPLVEGAYSVEISNGQGCSIQSPGYDYAFSGLAHINRNTFRVYPNPVTDVLNIHTGIRETATIYIHAIDGTLMETKPVSGNCLLSLEHLPSGCYVLSMQSGGLKKRAGFVKK